MIRPLGIEHQTALGLPPVELVALAAKLECPYLGIVLSTRPYNTIRQRGAVYREDTIDRMVPGEGELPLREILAAVPHGVPVGLEVPMLSRALAGESTDESARRCVQGARALLATLDEGPTSR